MAAPLQDSSLRAGRSGQRLAVVPRPGFAGQYAKGSNKIERNQYAIILPPYAASAAGAFQAVTPLPPQAPSEESRPSPPR